jgi:ferredoxin-NADP reductase
MNIQEYLSNVEGFNEAVEEREILKRVFGDLTLPRDFVENFVSLLHPKSIDVKVVDIIEETPSTKTLRLSPKDGHLPPFRAGQYVSLKLKIGKVLTGRSFTISSPPHTRGYYDVTVRRMEKGFVSHYLMDDVKIGDEFEISAPSGSFYHEPLTDGKNLVFIGGGSGITPFKSIIREVIDRGLDFNIWLIYGSRTTDDVIFGDEFEEISKKHKNIKYRLVVSEPPKGYKGTTGFITADVIKDFVGDVKGKTFYMCGPNLMYSFVQPELEKLKVLGRKIKKEAYGPPADITKEPGWPADITADKVFKIKVRDGKTIDAKAGEPILNSLERAGLVSPYLCRSGECSYCRTKVHSGKAFMPDRVTVRESDRWYDYIHSCMAYPLSDMEISY